MNDIEKSSLFSDASNVQSDQVDDAEGGSPPLEEWGIQDAAEDTLVNDPKRGRVISSGNVKSSGTGTLSLVHSVIPDAPVSPDAVIPMKFTLSKEGGIYEMKKNNNDDKEVNIFSSAVFISERYRSIDTNKESVKISWYRDNKWNNKLIEKKVISDSREIVSLSNFGLPVNTLNSSNIIRYLHDYEVSNEGCIGLYSTAGRFGWFNGKTCFLLGRSTVTETSISLAGNPFSPEGFSGITFQGSDDGDDQIADGFHEEGSLEAWVDIANQAVEHPAPLVIFLAACVPPLLEILGASNFVVETAGVTSTGKTTALRLAASVWGCPDERAEASVLHTWDVTPVWIERAAGILNGLPLILDDTKRVFSKLSEKEAISLINSVVYAYASGKGRGRGSLSGTQRTGVFRSVLISSGEEPCSGSGSAHGGAHARILSLWGSPFGSDNQRNLVRSVNQIVMENYGHAGPLLVQHLIRNRDLWPQWKKEYSGLLQDYSDLAGENNVAGRLAEIFAVLELTSSRILEAVPGLQFPRPVRDVLLEVWADTAGRAAESADRALVALQEVWNWAVANQQKFFGRHRTDGDSRSLEPHGGWAGCWKDGDGWTDIGFLRGPLVDLLKKKMFDPDATIRTWADRGWLERDNKGRNQRQRVINGAKGYCYCVRKEALEDALRVDLSDPVGFPLCPQPPKTGGVSNPFVSASPQDVMRSTTPLVPPSVQDFQ